MNLKSIITDELQNKMNIGPDGKMTLTPEMMDAFGIPRENYYDGMNNYDPAETSPVVSLSDIPKRPINSQEYNDLPLSSKGGIFQLFDIGYFFCLIVISFMGMYVITLDEFKENMPNSLIFIIVLGVILIGITIGNLVKGITSRSKISVGNVVFCNAKKIGNRRPKYYLTIHFPESNQIVRDVKCYYKTFKKVKIGSKIYVYKNRAYAPE